MYTAKNPVKLINEVPYLPRTSIASAMCKIRGFSKYYSLLYDILFQELFRVLNGSLKIQTNNSQGISKVKLCNNLQPSVQMGHEFFILSENPLCSILA